MKKKTIRLTRLPLLGSVLLLGACHKEGISDSTSKPSSNTSTSADDSDLIVTYDGNEVENGANLEITVGSTTGQIVVDGASATFSSSDDSVLAVDQHSGLQSEESRNGGHHDRWRSFWQTHIEFHG